MLLFCSESMFHHSLSDSFLTVFHLLLFFAIRIYLTTILSLATWAHTLEMFHFTISPTSFSFVSHWLSLYRDQQYVYLGTSCYCEAAIYSTVLLSLLAYFSYSGLLHQSFCSLSDILSLVVHDLCTFILSHFLNICI